MTSKGQEFLKYTDDERNKILEKLLNGFSSVQLEKEYGIPAKTIRNWKKNIIYIQNYI